MIEAPVDLLLPCCCYSLDCHGPLRVQPSKPSILHYLAYCKCFFLGALQAFIKALDFDLSTEASTIFNKYQKLKLLRNYSIQPF